MTGDECRRFCGQCRLHVYNLSAMTRAQAELFLERSEGRVCVRLYRRRDGTVMTTDCPVGMGGRFARRLGRLIAAGVGLLLVGLLAAGASNGSLGRAWAIVSEISKLFQPHSQGLANR